MSVEKILSERLNVDVSTITDESHIVDDLGADSLSVVEVIMDIESEYEVEIPVSYTHLTLPTKRIV